MGPTLYAKCPQCGSVNRFENREGEHPVCAKCSARLNPRRATSDKPLGVSDATFSDEVLEAEVPVLVDFFATWCGACRSVEPAVEALASRYKGRLKVATLDVEQSPESARAYKIRGTPTLIVFRDGQPVGQIVGAAPESQLDRMVEKYLT
ncbi:MAG: thioredoxin [Candidatus Hydrogenedentota bacterium]|nr:MAG: thioredoxin [Candidatus Hydrogenedentota bacterium]